MKVHITYPPHNTRFLGPQAYVVLQGFALGAPSVTVLQLGKDLADQPAPIQAKPADGDSYRWKLELPALGPGWYRAVVILDGDEKQVDFSIANNKIQVRATRHPQP
jgi:hypothetical protein